MLSENQIKVIEETINYNFKNKFLLNQAFTRKSYSKENPEFADNEVLEFYGDKILSFILAKEFSEVFGEFKEIQPGSIQFVSAENEGMLTNRHSQLTKNISLIEKMQDSDLLQFVQKSKNDSFSGKSEGDIFEAILGAVALDSGWSTKALKTVIDQIINPSKNYETRVFDTNDFSSRLQDVCSKNNIEYPNPITTQTTDGFISKLTIIYNGNKKQLKQKAMSKKGAELAITRRAYIYIKLILLYEVVEERIINPVSQLQELKNENLIQNIEFKCDSILPANNSKKNNLWNCTCSVTTKTGSFQESAVKCQNIKSAKYNAARKIIPLILVDLKKQSLKGQGLLKLILQFYQN